MNPAQPAPGTRLCALADLPDPGAEGFEFFEGDARFAFDKSGWREIAREDHATPDGLAYSYVTLVRD